MLQKSDLSFFSFPESIFDKTFRPLLDFIAEQIRSRGADRNAEYYATGGGAIKYASLLKSGFLVDYFSSFSGKIDLSKTVRDRSDLIFQNAEVRSELSFASL